MRYTRVLEVLRVWPKPVGMPGEVQQLDDDVLQHMAAPGALLQALQSLRARPRRSGARSAQAAMRSGVH